MCNDDDDDDDKGSWCHLEIDAGMNLDRVEGARRHCEERQWKSENVVAVAQNGQEKKMTGEGTSETRRERREIITVFGETQPTPYCKQWNDFIFLTTQAAVVGSSEASLNVGNGR